MIYTIGTLSFDTQEKAIDYTRNILERNGENTIIDRTHPDFQFFLDLLENHSNKEKKIGCGIESFLISKNERRTGLETTVNRLDKTPQTFSWKDCAKQSTQSQELILDSALRTAIDRQIQEFRKEKEEVCENPSCRKQIKCAVDHKAPTFYEIKMEFLRNNTTTPKEFDKQPRTNQHIFKDSDKDFCLKWQSYHKQSAILQYLCTECHKKKTKQDNKKINLLKTKTNHH